PDGRIWTFDRKITSMDTSLENLPSPLPDWFANLDWNIIRLGIAFAQIIFSIYLAIQTVLWQRPKKTKSS
ncbi:MAG: hypothetical protein AB1750_05255, partial [Chloroflexota bacterium]